MFCLITNQEEESKASQFTALSLSTGVQLGIQQSHFPSQVSNKMKTTSFPYVRNRESPPYDSKESLMKVKRKRTSLDGTALSIGSGSSSSLLEVNKVDHHPVEQTSCARFGGEYSCRNKPHPIADMPGGVVGSASEMKSLDEAILYYQFAQGLGSENADERSAYGAADLASVSSDANDSNRACLYQQSVNRRAFGRASRSRTLGTASISDKIHHRMIKNRESAARSRARKQALEAQQQLENAELKKENDFLKRVVRFLLAVLRTKNMKLPALSRSFSGPL